MGKRILVTGGAGFVGSHLCRKLLEQGNYVICLDNFFTGQKDNIKSLLEHPGFELIEQDVEHPFCEDMDVDQIYNLACPASPVHYRYDAIKTVKTNILGALNVLDLAKKTNARILQASTSEVYGEPLVHPQTEDYCGNVNPIGLRSCYDEGKRVAETLFFDYHRTYGIDIRVIRIFNTYGPNMCLDDGRVVSNFIVQALKNEDVTIYGDGSQTRSFCYVSDLIDGMMKCMNYEEDNFTGPVNLGNPQELTMNELAAKIIQLCGSESEVVYREIMQNDPTRRRPCIDYAKSKLDWSPKVDLEDGLKSTITYFKERLNGGGNV